MIEIKRIYERPSADIPFYHELRGENKLIQKHMYENYILKKKCANHKQMMSDDKLKFTSYVTWASDKDFFDFVTDVTFSRLVDQDSSKKYEEKHGITMTVEFKDLSK
jgi:hypothetical protein